MASENEPTPWETTAAAPKQPPPTMESGASPPSNFVSRAIRSVSAERWLLIMRIVNILNAILLCVVCFFAFAGKAASNGGVTGVFLAIYIGVFGLILLIFETRSNFLGSERFIRRTFGFMFTPWGRTLFLLFIGCLSIGFVPSSDDEEKGDVKKSARDWALAGAVITTINAVLSCFLLCIHPGFKDVSKRTTDPRDLSEAQVRAYLSAHPELATQASNAFNTESAAAPPVAADFGSGSAERAGHRNTSFAAIEKEATGTYTPPAVGTSNDGNSNADESNPFDGSARAPAAPETSSTNAGGSRTIAPPAPSNKRGGKKKGKGKNKKAPQPEPEEDDNPFK